MDSRVLAPHDEADAGREGVRRAQSEQRALRTARPGARRDQSEQQWDGPGGEPDGDALDHSATMSPSQEERHRDEHHAEALARLALVDLQTTEDGREAERDTEGAVASIAYGLSPVPSSNTRRPWSDPARSRTNLISARSPMSPSVMDRQCGPVAFLRDKECCAWANRGRASSLRPMGAVGAPVARAGSYPAG